VRKLGGQGDGAGVLARQVDDETLRKLADRIKARAIRRVGELLRELDARPQNAQKQNTGTGTLISKREAAEQAGLSKRQKDTAARVANIPDEEFEKLVESDDPPTLTQLAEMGTKKREVESDPLLDGTLFREHGITPESFGRLTDFTSAFRTLVEALRRLEPEDVPVGVLPVKPGYFDETRWVLENTAFVFDWLTRLTEILEERRRTKKDDESVGINAAG
jgi:hypothetical protein